MNPDLSKLQPYPFERLRRLQADIEPPANKESIALSIGEPKHDAPDFVLECLQTSQYLINSYPTTKGSEQLRQAICGWLQQRFKLPYIDFEQQVLPVNGTREALFSFAQCVADRNNRSKDLILIPNPFYQIYEGATFLAGLTPSFYNITAQNGYAPNFDAIDDKTWARCQMIYLCSPGNPTGAIISQIELQKLINKAEQFNFIIACDECYSEIYFDESKPPGGLLQAANELGNTQFKRCVVFHSLSKRSNLPGMRSGFVAGDADILQQYLLFRTYHGCAMSASIQVASAMAWQDEQHVINNRLYYQQKFSCVLDILQGTLSVKKPDASFYLWPKLPVDDEHFTRELYRQYALMVLPGSYLSRKANGINPGQNHVRMALVAPLQDCVNAARQIKQLTEIL